MKKKMNILEKKKGGKGGQKGGSPSQGGTFWG